MATDDRQIFVAGTAGAPAQWRVPGNGQIRPKAVYATFDGTGAAGVFLPILEVFSDGGELVGRYKAEASVAAGGSADVSWFPHVAAAVAAPAGASIPYGFYTRFLSPSIASDGVQHVVSLDTTAGDASFGSSADGDITFVLSGGNYVVSFNAFGLYIVAAQVEFDRAGAPAAGAAGTLQMTGANYPTAGARYVPYVAAPDSAGRFRCDPSYLGVHNHPNTGPAPPFLSALSAAQSSGAGSGTFAISLIAYRIDPDGNPNF